MLRNCVFTLDSVFRSVLPETQNRLTNQCLYSCIALLSYVSGTAFAWKLAFFEILVNRFMTQDDSSGANVISNCMSWVRALVPFSEF